jgi:bifunctional DNA-binding transcriptional regulator/antitoxin component of YhaV-PrlF toxin-antitoxin module
MEVINAGSSRVYNIKRQVYLPKLVTEALGVGVGDCVQWIVDTKKGEVRVEKGDGKNIRKKSH